MKAPTDFKRYDLVQASLYSQETRITDNITSAVQNIHLFRNIKDHTLYGTISFMSAEIVDITPQTIVIIDLIIQTDVVTQRIRLTGLCFNVQSSFRTMSQSGDAPNKRRIITLEFIDYSALHFLTQQIKFTLENTRIKNVLDKLCNKMFVEGTNIKIHDKIEYIDTPVNRKTFGSICIPSQTFLQAIKFLNNQYGIYNGETFVYLECDSWKGSWKNIVPRVVVSGMDMLTSDVSTVPQTKLVIGEETVRGATESSQNPHTGFVNNGFKRVTKSMVLDMCKNTPQKFFESDTLDLSTVYTECVGREDPNNLIDKRGFVCTYDYGNAKYLAQISQNIPLTYIAFSPYVWLKDDFTPGTRVNLEVTDKNFLKFERRYFIFSDEVDFEKSPERWEITSTVTLVTNRLP
jgi:hypothetical protein